MLADRIAITHSRVCPVLVHFIFFGGKPWWCHDSGDNITGMVFVRFKFMGDSPMLDAIMFSLMTFIAS